MRKSNDSPEFYEVLKGTIRDRSKPSTEPSGGVAVAPPPETAETSTVTNVTTVTEGASTPPAPEPAAGASAPMGERTLTIKYDTLAFLLFFLLGALFVAFALGALWGQQKRASQFSDPTPPAPEQRQGVVPVPRANDGTATLVSGPVTATPAPAFGEPLNQPPAPLPGTGMPPPILTPVAPPPVLDPATTEPMAMAEDGPYTICLVQFPDQKYAENRSKVWKEQYRLNSEPFVREGTYSGKPAFDVCYGHFATSEAAAAEVEKWQKREATFKPAFVVDTRKSK